jgi:ABC-type transport system substrate-binding protein
MGNPDEISNPTDAGFAYPAIEGLVTIGEGSVLKPWLAERWEIAPDGKAITFYLRKGVKFHDGTPFNAQAVKVNFDIQIKTKAWMNLKSMTSTEVIDDYTIKCNLKAWDWTMMNSLSFFFSCMMFSPTALTTQSPEWLRGHPVGTGPFKFVAHERDRYIRYERNEDYWRGRPYLDGIEFKFIPDPTTTLLAFKSGEIDSAGIGAQDVEDIEKAGFEVSSTKGWIIGLYPDSNTPTSPFHDIRVRRALEYAIDKKELAEGLGYGYSRPCDQVFLEESPGWNPDVKGYPFNVAKAKQLLTEAGYPNGFKTKLTMVEFMQLDMPIAVQDMLKKNVNIDIEFNRVSMGQFSFQIAQPPGWEGLCVGASPEMTGSDPGNVLVNGVINYNTTWIGVWEPPDCIELARQASAETNVEKRMALYRQISKLLTDEYAVVCNLYDLTFFTAVSPKVKNHTVGKLGYGPFAWTFAWLEE